MFLASKLCLRRPFSDLGRSGLQFEMGAGPSSAKAIPRATVNARVGRTAADACVGRTANVQEAVARAVDFAVPSIPRVLQRIVVEYVARRYVRWIWDEHSSAVPAFDVTTPDPKRPELVRFAPAAGWPRLGDDIDMLDRHGFWYNATVIHVSKERHGIAGQSIFWIHYNGWQESWDEVMQQTTSSSPQHVWRFVSCCIACVTGD